MRVVTPLACAVRWVNQDGETREKLQVSYRAVTGHQLPTATPKKEK